MDIKTRIYAVFADGAPIGLVRAKSQAEAVRHYTEPRFEAIVADQDHLTSEWGRSAAIEDAGEVPA